MQELVLVHVLDEIRTLLVQQANGTGDVQLLETIIRSHLSVFV